jgi:hypothetical protein
MNEILNSYKPGIPKKLLLLVAGIVWVSIAYIAINLGMNYIFDNSHHILFHLLISFIIGLFLFLVIFFKVFNNYTNRIIRLNSDKPCLFSFSSIKSYFITAFIFTLALYIKKYNFIDSLILSISYVGIGISLFFSSLKLFYSFITFKKIANSSTFSTAA